MKRREYRALVVLARRAVQSGTYRESRSSIPLPPGFSGGTQAIVTRHGMELRGGAAPFRRLSFANLNIISRLRRMYGVAPLEVYEQFRHCRDADTFRLPG